MAIINQILALIFAPLTLIIGWTGLRSSITNDPAQYKNVIFLIGDGMSENTLSTALAEDTAPLAIHSLPVRGESKTNAWPGFVVTDSAAGGTALACGIRNIVAEIGVYPLAPFGVVVRPANLSEMALKSGRSAGVVTTDLTSGATPATFSAHASTRIQEGTISKSQLNSGLNLIWGGASKSITKENANAKGFAYVDNKADWEALAACCRSFAQFDNGFLANTTNTTEVPTLDEMTTKAIDLLGSNEKGFFLMVEAAHIDKFAHDNNKEMVVHHVREFDKAVKIAIDYAADNADTLVIVTADHETGGIKLKDGDYVFTSGGHTKANVPVYVNRDDAGFTDGGVWKNRQIGAQMGRVMGFGPDMFPTPILPRK